MSMVRCSPGCSPATLRYAPEAVEPRGIDLQERGPRPLGSGARRRPQRRRTTHPAHCSPGRTRKAWSPPASTKRKHGARRRAHHPRPWDRHIGDFHRLVARTRYWPGEGLAPATEQWYRDVLGVLRPARGGLDPHVHRAWRALTLGDVEAMTGALGCSDFLAPHSRRGPNCVRSARCCKLGSGPRVSSPARRPARQTTPGPRQHAAQKVKADTVAEVAVDPRRARRHPVWHPVTVVGVTTGLRPGELLALHWADVHPGGAHPARVGPPGALPPGRRPPESPETEPFIPGRAAHPRSGLGVLTCLAEGPGRRAACWWRPVVPGLARARR